MEKKNASKNKHPSENNETDRKQKKNAPRTTGSAGATAGSTARSATAARRNEFLHIGNNSDPLDVLATTLKNFYGQARDPAFGGLYEIPLKAVALGVNLLEGTLEKIKDIITNKMNETMENKQKQDTVPENNTDRKYRFMPSQINWQQAGELGITKEYLEQKGLLDQMLQGRKTNQLIPISTRLGGTNITTDAKLSLRQEQDGSISLRIHGVRKEPELDRPYFGHVFTPQDKENLREIGHMGRVVELYDRAGEAHPSFISIDPLTKEIASVRAKGIFIPDEVSRIKLTDQEKQDLRDGKEIFVEGMTAKTGKEFDAYLRVDANERRVVYRFEEGLANVRKIGGVELSEQQREDLQAGKTILVEGMVSKQTGEIRDSYVKAADLATGKLLFTNFNPDSPEEKREIIVPRYVGQVLLDKADQDELAAGRAIFVKDQVRASGETYDSFVRLHPATGNIQRSKTPDGFTDEVKAEIPKEISGVKVTAKMRADLQDGKAVEVKGAKALDGTPVPTFVKLNRDTNLLSFYRENPDQAKKATVSTQEQPGQAAENKKRGARVS